MGPQQRIDGIIVDPPSIDHIIISLMAGRDDRIDCWVEIFKRKNYDVRERRMQLGGQQLISKWLR